MPDQKSLKEQNDVLYWAFAVANIIILVSLIISKKIDLQHISKIWTLISAKEGIWILLLPIVGVSLNGLLSSKIKAMIIFTRIKHVLPGHRAFSKLGKTDVRIHLDRVIKKNGKSPRNPIEQNKMWYDIYKKHENNIVIKDSHKKFLLMRDIASLSFLFLLSSFIVFIIYFSVNRVMIFYLLFNCIQFLITMISARNYGNGFVCNVLAEESTIY